MLSFPLQWGSKWAPIGLSWSWDQLPVRAVLSIRLSCTGQFAQVKEIDYKTASEMGRLSGMSFILPWDHLSLFAFSSLENSFLSLLSLSVSSKFGLALRLDLPQPSDAWLCLGASPDASCLPHLSFFPQFPHFSSPRGLSQIILLCHPPARSQTSMSSSLALGWVKWLFPTFLSG